MTWALKRQILYISVLLTFFLGLGILVIYPQFNKVPTCTDGKQNGEEAGVDCGGACAKACLNQVDEISVIWARTFKIVPGRYNAVAYLVNHNKSAAINKINYRFRFADKNNLYIGKRDGSTYVPPGGAFPVFEPAIDLGNSSPVYTTFEFTESPSWTYIPQEKIEQAKVLVSNLSLGGTEDKPRLSAVVKNNSLLTIPDVSLVAILYDASRNAVSTSRTLIQKLGPNEKEVVTFTWPEPFDTQVVTEEVVPIYNLFEVKTK